VCKSLIHPDMKSYVIAVLLILTTYGATLHGQTFHGGLSLGMVSSQVSGDQSAGYNKLGFYGGPWAHFSFRENWRFQRELAFMQKGSRENPSEENGHRSYKLNLNYVEMPLMFRWLYREKIEFEFGVAYGFLISSYEEENFVELNTRPFHTHNSSLVIGLFYHLSDRLHANFRTSNSITPIRQHISGGTSIRHLNFGQTNNILTLGLFYRI
jgi:hypothetical protein